MNEKFAVAQNVARFSVSAVATFLGWRGFLAIVWIVSMALDYVSGTVAAIKAGDWTSTQAREGLFHKGGVILIVFAAVLLDFLLKIMQQSGALDLPFVYNATLMPLTMGWFTITEIGSAIENAAKMGVEIPPWLLSKIRQILSAINGSQDKPEDEKPDNKNGE